MERILIAALDGKGVIGNKGKLPWKISEDMKHFKELTMGHPIIMGRKTWESLPGALPGRQNIILSKSLTEPMSPTAFVMDSLEKSLNTAEAAGYEKAYIIGGAQIYEQALPIIDKMEITHVYGIHEGDTYFPSLDWSKWSSLKVKKHEDFAFATYVRREAK